VIDPPRDQASRKKLTRAELVVAAVAIIVGVSGLVLETLGAPGHVGLMMASLATLALCGLAYRRM
jgi:hypothetical protein